MKEYRCVHSRNEALASGTFFGIDDALKTLSPERDEFAASYDAIRAELGDGLDQESHELRKRKITSSGNLAEQRHRVSKDQEERGSAVVNWFGYATGLTIVGWVIDVFWFFSEATKPVVGFNEQQQLVNGAVWHAIVRAFWTPFVAIAVGLVIAQLRKQGPEHRIRETQAAMARISKESTEIEQRLEDLEKRRAAFQSMAKPPELAGVRLS